MPSRHEEKYIIDYQQYAILRARALGVLTPDANAKGGSYVITSLYFDAVSYTHLTLPTMAVV